MKGFVTGNQIRTFSASNTGDDLFEDVSRQMRVDFLQAGVQHGCQEYIMIAGALRVTAIGGNIRPVMNFPTLFGKPAQAKLF